MPSGQTKIPVLGSRSFYDPGMLIELDPKMEPLVRGLAEQQDITPTELIARAVREYCVRRGVPLEPVDPLNR